jgi:hypothetical protein
VKAIAGHRTRDSVYGRREEFQSFRDCRKIELAGCGKGDASTVTMKQWRAKPLLERLDGMTHPTRCDTELLGCELEALPPARSLEKAQCVQGRQSMEHVSSS